MKYALLLALFVTGSSFADTYDLTRRLGIGGGAGWNFPILDNKFDDFAGDDFTYNFHARYHFNSADALQLSFQNYEFKNTTIGANVMDVMWLRRMNRIDRLTPVFGLAAGVADMKNISPYHDNMKFAARARAGMEYALTQDLFASVTVDYQYIGKMLAADERGKFPGQEIHTIVPQVNLTYFFGAAKEEKKAVASKPVAATFVDSDNDGVEDRKDKCPNTPAGSKVNAYGCLVDEAATQQIEVLFASNSAEVPPVAHVAIQELADFMKEHPETKVVIEGHTDSTGNPAKNMTLSQQRADSVKNYMVSKLGIDATRLSSKGYGADRPIADNATVEGRNKNRRVMAVITQ